MAIKPSLPLNKIKKTVIVAFVGNKGRNLNKLLDGSNPVEVEKFKIPALMTMRGRLCLPCSA